MDHLFFDMYSKKHLLHLSHYTGQFFSTTGHNLYTTVLSRLQQHLSKSPSWRRHHISAIIFSYHMKLACHPLCIWKWAEAWQLSHFKPNYSYTCYGIIEGLTANGFQFLNSRSTKTQKGCYFPQQVFLPGPTLCSAVDRKVVRQSFFKKIIFSGRR